MSWNFRIIENKRDPDPAHHYVFIAEVYYNKKDEPVAYTHKFGVNMFGEDIKSLKWYYKTCKEAFLKPVINIEHFGDNDIDNAEL